MIINNPISGTITLLENVSDAVFAQKMMGDGIAITPTNGTVVAPIDGVLTTVFPTKHAIGIKGEDGVEILIHIGINTVELAGKHFDLKVTQDQSVKTGDILVEVDLDAIKKAGYETVTPIIILNTSDYQAITPLAPQGTNLEINQPLLDIA